MLCTAFQHPIYRGQPKMGTLSTVLVYTISVRFHISNTAVRANFEKIFRKIGDCSNREGNHSMKEEIRNHSLLKLVGNSFHNGGEVKNVS